MFLCLYLTNDLTQKNIGNYAAAVLLSSKISAYKGTIPTNTLLVCIHYCLNHSLIVGWQRDAETFNERGGGGMERGEGKVCGKTGVW